MLCVDRKRGCTGGGEGVARVRGVGLGCGRLESWSRSRRICLEASCKARCASNYGG